MKRILIVEDEAAIREFEAINLKRAGYETVEAGSGEEAIEIYDSDLVGFDIALLDVMMPGMDGFTLCKEIRKRSASIGIIMLTAKSQEMDKISGLMTGADDYITKPFSPAELLARVDSLYRRVELQSARAVSRPDEISLGEFTLDLRRRTLTKSGVNIELTQVEFQIVEYFFTNPDTVLS
ncbi:MAG: response regulator transcription factor, partial [Clostridia bacterium]|nr:response regulator transcription factor [Clostridia bacterium]